MKIDRLPIEGLLLMEPKRHADERGWFSELFREDEFVAYAGPVKLVQQNESFSKIKGTVRGLHFQLAPKAQGKLVRCSQGAILDVALDLRSSSSTYGRHFAVELSAANGLQLWIPPGFAHGFCTLEPDACISYSVTDYYSPDHDRGLLWSDPALGIPWPVVGEEAIVSQKDAAQPRFSALGPVFS